MQGYGDPLVVEVNHLCGEGVLPAPRIFWHESGLASPTTGRFGPKLKR